MDKITVESKLEFKEYLKLQHHLLYGKSAGGTIIAFLGSLLILTGYLRLCEIDKIDAFTQDTTNLVHRMLPQFPDFIINSFDRSFNEWPIILGGYIEIFLGLIILIGVPLSQYRRAKKIVQEAAKIKTIYEFSSEKVCRKVGDLMVIEVFWKGINEVEELENWYLIKVTNWFKFTISKKNFTPEQLINLRELLSNIEIPIKKILPTA